ncbi:putative inactive receptor-like protein kinase [Quercus suber]|uniref:Inactive receptor-like protein kinase n=1 Tax=Quercus suber TaxID=58331 RepID=A0AAW0IKS9_QUESU
MESRRDLDLFLKRLVCITVLPLLITVCIGAVDPQNVLGIAWNGLVAHPCLHKLRGVKCNSQSIVEIRLENLNLSGILDVDALCKLPNLKVLSLAKNHIRGNIPNSILHCTRLTYLNLSNNHLSGRLPLALTKLKYLRRLDISTNHLTSVKPHFVQEFRSHYTYYSKSSSLQRNSTGDWVEAVHSRILSEGPSPYDDHDSELNGHWIALFGVLPLVLGIGLFVVHKAAKEREILKKVRDSPLKTPPVKAREEVKPVERHSGLVFFVEEHERFILEDSLKPQLTCKARPFAAAFTSALYAVKRLKQLQVSFEEFSQTMIQIGSLKRPNILPLVGYHSTNKEELFIYKYQSQGSLLNSLEDYIDGKRDFPWELRLSIASGIASGLNFIYQSSDNQEIIPHGNLKLSNILDENNKALISEYGFSRFLNPKACNLTANGYTAPEKLLAEQGDVFSFGVILLELLTSKTVEKSGIDLPKWVRAMVSEEWTGEVFDRESCNTMGISFAEYCSQVFLNPKACNLTANGYTAPEKLLAEQGDVFSFGVILLELLTSKTVEKSGIDLPKWVRAMVSEEWTGEVFDREVSKAATQWEFPLLDIALKCVSHSPDDRPTTTWDVGKTLQEGKMAV